MLTKSVFIRYPGIIILAFIATIIGGSKSPNPPILQEEGIKVLTFSTPIWGGMSITWESSDDRINIGDDEFVICVSERQIPQRTGWSAWREVGRTKDTSFTADGFWRSRDIRVRIEVDKGAIE